MMFVRMLRMNNYAQSTCRVFSTQNMGIFAKSKELYKKYWWPCTIAYSALYCSTLGLWFVLLDLKLLNITSMHLDPIQVVDSLSDMYEKFSGRSNLGEYLDANPRMKTFALSLAANELLEPVRILGVLYFVPKFINRKK